MNKYKELSKKTQRIVELEKEIAELKDKLAEQKQYTEFKCSQAVKVYEQLTKAKELIKKMAYEYQRLCLIKKETLTEAEQFLREIEQ